MSEEKQKLPFSAGHPRAHFWAILTTSIIGGLIIIALGSAVAFETIYATRILPGVHVGEVNLAGLTIKDATTLLQQKAQPIVERGIVFRGGNKQVTINTVEITLDPDLARPVVTFDWNKTAQLAYEIGRSNNPATNVINQLRTAVGGVNVMPAYSFDRNELITTLRANFSDQEQQPKNASIDFSGSVPTVSPEINGATFDYEAAATQAEKQIQHLVFNEINLSLQTHNADVTAAQAQMVIGSASSTIALAPLTIQGDAKRYTIDQNTLKTWLEFQQQDSHIVLGANKALVESFLDTVAHDIDIPAQDAHFQLEGDKVSMLAPSQDGKELDREATYSNINNAIITGTTTPIELVVKVTISKVGDANLEGLGVKELIGRGVSNFAGSPKNRRHNIETGAKALNGILIKPNEEFSVIQALGEIDGEHGYLQELVIKGDRTLPEFGGGLCQIGTTTFRAALRSGLPITERRNHSYRVVYYEPAGTDATIYDPQPDLRFLNDTGHYILFVTRMDGDNLIFEFYGTKDGREVTITPDPPRIFNVTPPGPAHYIQTTDLAPGQKKKVESAHAGADTFFQYIVKYPNGEVKEKDFASHYVPWPEVWQVGVAATSTSSSTEPLAKNLPTATTTTP